MSKRGALVILCGAIPATGWGIYLVKVGWGWRPVRISVCWFCAVAPWIAALAPEWASARAVCRWAVVLGLFLGICLAAVPAVLIARLLLVYFGALPLREHLVGLSVVGSLAAPIAVAACSIRSMLVARQ